MRLHVGNLPKQITEEQLSELAAPFGTLVSATVAIERRTGSSRGFGFIEFSTADEGLAAIAALDGREVGGQTLAVSQARPREPRTPRS